MNFAGNWSDFGAGGLALEGELSTDADFGAGSRKRRSERVACDLGAGLRQRGATGISVQIVDLSADGFRAATHLQLEKGTDVWLRLPGLEASHARVMWTERHFIGCAFTRALHPAVVDMIVRKGRSN